MREKKRENGESYEWKQSQAKKWRGETNENEPNRDQKRSVLPRRATIRYLLHETSKYPLLFMLLNGCHFSNVVVKQKEKRKRPTASDRNVWALKQWQAFHPVRAGFRAHMGAQDSLQLYSPGMYYTVLLGGVTLSASCGSAFRTPAIVILLTTCYGEFAS